MNTIAVLLAYTLEIPTDNLPTLIISIAAITTAFLGIFKFLGFVNNKIFITNSNWRKLSKIELNKLDKIYTQLHPNGGTSVIDKINKLETVVGKNEKCLRQVQSTMESIEKELAFMRNRGDKFDTVEQSIATMLNEIMEEIKEEK